MILKLSATGGGLLGLKGFNTPMSVSVNSSTGECWVAETGSNMVIKLSPGGDGLFAVKGFKNVTSVSVNSSTGECWAVDTGGIGEAPIQRVKKISPAGSVLVDKKITGCKLISADSSTGGCWVYVSSPSKILELDTDGNVVNSLTVSGHGTAYSIATSQEP
jgi:hypothetical protein